MKQRKFWFGLAGLALLALASSSKALSVRPLQVISSEASCRMRVDVVEPISGSAQGYVVLFHGWRRTVELCLPGAGFGEPELARVRAGFSRARENAGPFSQQRTDACGEALVKELIERRAIVPSKRFWSDIRWAERLPFA